MGAKCSRGQWIMVNAMLPTVLDRVHFFWFGPLPDFDTFPEDRLSLWFGGARDAEIAGEFEDVLREADGADLELAALSAAQQVALVVLFDQFPRSIFRGHSRSYAYDESARAAAMTACSGGMSRFKLVERAFLTICLGHSERLADQEAALRYYLDEIAPFAPAGNRFYEGGRIQTQKYLEIIRRFGRFPHRNAILGRESTAEEEQFLAESRIAPF